MPSHKFVPGGSKNFTSHPQIRFPPTTPIHPVFGKRNQNPNKKGLVRNWLTLLNRLSKWTPKTNKKNDHWSIPCYSMLCHAGRKRLL